jgi:acyl-coenzyme A synthetase/AMP-(fatty) acid ligase
MPVWFRGDGDGRRYRASYFTEFPGRWRQGDFFRVNARGGCFRPRPAYVSFAKQWPTVEE